MFWLLLNSACTVSRPSLFPILWPQRVGWGWARSWERTQPWQLTWSGERDVPYHMVVCSATKLKVEGKEGEFVFQGGYCLEIGWASVHLWEVVSDCLSITWHHISFHLLNCSCLDPRVFSLLFSLFSLSSHWGEKGSEWAAVWVFGCWPGSTHHSNI